MHVFTLWISNVFLRISSGIWNTALPVHWDTTTTTYMTTTPSAIPKIARPIRTHTHSVIPYQHHSFLLLLCRLAECVCVTVSVCVMMSWACSHSKGEQCCDDKQRNSAHMHTINRFGWFALMPANKTKRPAVHSLSQIAPSCLLRAWICLVCDVWLDHAYAHTHSSLSLESRLDPSIIIIALPWLHTAKDSTTTRRR